MYRYNLFGTPAKSRGFLRQQKRTSGFPEVLLIENSGIQSIPVVFCLLAVYNQGILRRDRPALLDERKQIIV